MLIEFWDNDSVFPQDLRFAAEQFLFQAARNVGLDPDLIALAVISDEANYPAAVTKISPDSPGFTRPESGKMGIGKSGILQDPDGNLRPAIALNLNVFGEGLAIFAGCSEICHDRALGELSFYVVHHEMGHCKDAILRPGQPIVPKVREGFGFEIEQFSRYHSGIVEAEFAASVFSALWMSRAAYQNADSHFQADADTRRVEAARAKQSCLEGTMALSELAFIVGGGVWSALIQFAKLVATHLGNPELESPAAHFVWSSRAEAVAELFGQFDLDLRTHWRSYPWRTGGVPVFMRDAWIALGEIEGFRFLQGERGSAIYF